MSLGAVFIGTCLLLVSGLHIAVVLFGLGAATGLGALGPSALDAMGMLVWGTSNNFIFAAVPLFILLGELLLRTGLADRMYQALAAWLGWLPGGLLHTNIGASALFAATSGSSVATAATVGTVAMPLLAQRGYDVRLTLGSLAAGGTLGILIPPSINMVIYGAMTNTSVGDLFVAGVVPGILLTLMFMGTIVVLSVLRGGRMQREPALPLRDRVRLSAGLVGPLVIFVVVMGSIYAGLATPTEAAALGVVAAFVLAARTGRLTLALLNEICRNTVRTSAVMLLIFLAAFYLNFFVSLLGYPQMVAAWVRDLGLTPTQTIWLLLLFYLLLGTFMETVAMMITTVGVVVPLVVALGYDPVWFGIFLVVLMELALISPPEGANLFVIQALRRDGGSIADVFVGVLPFALAMIGMAVLLIYVPELALWLPGYVKG